MENKQKNIKLQEKRTRFEYVISDFEGVQFIAIANALSENQTLSIWTKNSKMKTRFF